MATAYLIHGFVGAGKTTFARALERELPAIRFTHDEWMVELYGNDPPAEHFAEFGARVTKLMTATWTRCLALDRDVILDWGFWTRSERERTRQLVSAAGGQACLYRLNCAEDLAWSSVQDRNKRLDSDLLITRNTFDVLLGRFEPLAPDEDRIEINPAEDGFTPRWPR